MEQFFPSEIARLVLGYLKKECPEAAMILEANSVNLNEYRLLTYQNKNPQTTFNGITLSNILNQYLSGTIYIQKKLKEISSSQSTLHSGDLVTNFETIIRTITENNSNGSDLSVIYENLNHRLKSSENVQKMKVNNNEEQQHNVSVNDENFKIEILTSDQQNRLSTIFERIHYISYTERRKLAKEMGIPEITIKTWFQNKRNELRDHLRKKIKRPHHCNDLNDPTYVPPASTSFAANEDEMNCSSLQREKLRSHSPKYENNILHR